MRLPGRFLRRGGAAIELILVMPVFIIALFGIVEYGIWFANQQQLESASRLGALEASETDILPVTDVLFVGSDTDLAARRQLLQAGLDTSDANLRITLEHSVGGTVTTVESGSLICPPPTLPSPPSTADYVRVSVCMDIVGGKLAPNLLKTFGFDIDGRIAHQTTTLRWEPSMTP